jgi:hypothetical protein
LAEGTRNLVYTNQATTKPIAAKCVVTFEASRRKVNDKYFDSTFGGKDWQAIYDTYRQRFAHSLGRLNLLVSGGEPDVV